MPTSDPAGAVFAALSDGTRRGLLAQLGRHGEATATDLARGLPVSRQAVQKHLGTLAGAGLVAARRSGREVLYRPTGPDDQRPGLDGRGGRPMGRPAGRAGAALARNRHAPPTPYSEHMLGHVAVGTWSGGRFMRFGESLSDERLEALLRPGQGIRTLLTADAYGAGAADVLLGRALAGVPRRECTLVGAIGHDFYEGEPRGPKGFPRFTDRAARAGGCRDYVRMAAERSLERIGADSFDVLLLHNPDRRDFESPRSGTR